MSSQRIAFRTDANSEIGTGHFMRCVTLADELQKYGYEICFVSRGMPAYLIQMLNERNIEFYALTESFKTEKFDEVQHSHWLKTSQFEDAMQTISAIGTRRFDWLVVDHYSLDHRWENHLRLLAKQIMVIDDLADRHHDCDVLLDQNYHQDLHTRYLGKVPQDCHLLLGPTYALLRKEFKEVRKCLKSRVGEVKNVLIYFGGVDLNNLTGTTLRALINLNLHLHVDVVIGQQHPRIHEIEALCKSNNFVCHVQTNNMAILMATADLAIGAGGASNWERCCLGLPSIVIATAVNQVSISNELNKLGACANLGYFEKIDYFKIEAKISELIYSAIALANMSKIGMAIVDGNGVFHVTQEIIKNDY